MDRVRRSWLESQIIAGRSTRGYTKSKDWKILRGPSDALVVRMDAKTLAVEHEEFHGGSGDDSAWESGVDKHGGVFLAGQTDSPDLPGARRGFLKKNHGARDGFVARIGGTGKDEAGYAIDSEGDEWNAGMTYSADLATEGGYGGGDGEGFIAASSNALDRLRFAAYLASPARQMGEGMALLPGGAVMTMVRFGEGVAAGPFSAQSEITVWWRQHE